jgi:hypothetical protein
VSPVAGSTASTFSLPASVSVSTGFAMSDGWVVEHHEPRDPQGPSIATMNAT